MTWQGFKTLTPTEIKEVEDVGTDRKWIEGNGQRISWAHSTAQLLTKEKGDKDWREVKILDASMKGLLPRNWALEFSGGKVREG
jgi:hypothetical protein